MSVEGLSALALAVWQHGLQERGAHVFVVTRRVERELKTPVDPSSVSRACRELIEAGLADRSAFGYRRRQARQMELA